MFIEFLFLGEQVGNFHLILVNDSLDKAYNRLKEFVIKELEKPNGKITI